jgi:hypothetical protein
MQRPGLKALALILIVSTATLGEQPVPAQTPPAKVDLETIAKVCSGVSSAQAPGGEGSYTEGDGYKFRFSSDKSLEVSRSGTLLYKIDRFSYSDYYDCIAKLANTLSRPPINSPKVCRIPENGVERFGREFDVSQRSSEMSGGHSQPEWCSSLIAILRGQNVPGSEFTAVGSSESSRSGCAPFNCPLYTYTCTVHVKTDPAYREAASPNCP